MLEMKFFLIFTFLFYSVYSDQYTSSNLTINDLETSLKSDKNLNELTSIDLNKLISTLKSSHNYDFTQVHHNLKKENFPSHFDARKVWPECPSIGKIYDQRNGVPSWAYASVGQIADRLCIEYGVKINVEATIERMAKANGGFNSEYNSADIGKAFNYWSENGIFTVKSPNETNCLPFAPCEPAKAKFDQHYKVDVKIPVAVEDKMRDIMTNGPLTIDMFVHENFLNYKSGIYQVDNSKILGIHVIKIIGWGISNNVWYWIATNSWGTQWGEKGIFTFILGTSALGNNAYGLSASFHPTDDVTLAIDQDRLFELA